MSQPLRSAAATSFDGKTSHQTRSAVHLYSTDSDELTRLLVRCEEDLVTMDSILHELESAVEIDPAMTSERPAQSDPAPKRLQGAAASIHQIANDIDELHRSVNFDDVQTMLGNLQSKMVRCLRLLPASER